MVIINPFGEKDTPICETPFYKWLAERWEKGENVQKLKEELYLFLDEKGFQRESSGDYKIADIKSVRGIWEMFHYFKPWAKTYKPIDLNSEEGKKLIKQGLINAFGVAGIPHNGYFKIVNGNLWAQFSDIIGGRCIARVEEPDCSFIPVKIFLTNKK